MHDRKTPFLTHEEQKDAHDRTFALIKELFGDRYATVEDYWRDQPKSVQKRRASVRKYSGVTYKP
jgi:hypothetical protein